MAKINKYWGLVCVGTVAAATCGALAALKVKKKKENNCDLEEEFDDFAENCTETFKEWEDETAEAPKGAAEELKKQEETAPEEAEAAEEVSEAPENSEEPAKAPENSEEAPEETAQDNGETACPECESTEKKEAEAPEAE